MDEADARVVLRQISEFCGSLDLVEERLSHGEPTWFHRKGRSFAMFANHHHDDRVSIWMAAPPGFQEALIQSDGARFFRPPYVGDRGWVGMYLDVDFDSQELWDLLRSAHELTRMRARKGK